MTNRNQSKGLVGRVGAVLAKFRRRRHGAVAPILALAIIPILGSMGIGAEVSNWWLVQRTAQNAADSAVLAAAIDAGNNMTGSTYPTSTPTNNACTTVPSASASWYCQAISTAARYNYARSATVRVEPAIATCPNAAIVSQCYQVTITKMVPIYLLGVLGYNGSDVVAGAKYQRVSSTAYAAAPGPPVDFCILTTNGDIQTNGTPGANVQKCDTFSNGNTSCTGHGIHTGLSYATGTSDTTCENTPTIAPGGQAAECDPYGATTQTIQGNSVSCPLSFNSSSYIPTPPAGCTTANANVRLSNDSAFPTANVITQATINGATSMTVDGQVMQVVQMCGAASFGSGTVNGSGVATCGSTISYTGASANLLVVVYGGGLDLNGCTFQNNESTSSGGGVTIAFAPIPVTGGTCLFTGGHGNYGCIPVSNNSSGGELDLAAPKSGPFSGLAIMQSANYSEPSSGCTPSGSQSGPLDWCNAGNSPTLSIQGLVYVPNGGMTFAGAVSKFQQAGALDCMGLIIKSLTIKGTGLVIDNSGMASLTGQCTQAGVTLPGVPHTHVFYQALVG